MPDRLTRTMISKTGKLICVSVLALAVVTAGLGITHVYGNSDKQTFQRMAGRQQPFGKAAFSFGVTDLKVSGNIVTFTIPKDAHALEKKADAVELSGLYDQARADPGECPLVQSTEVSKSVLDYDPFSGKAHVKAEFDDPKMAAAAVDQGCVLIHDPK